MDTAVQTTSEQSSESVGIATLNQYNSPTAVTDINSVDQARWVPTLSIAYGTSESVQQRIAQLGDFVLGGKTCLGPTIKVVLLGYRLRACIWDAGKNSFGDSCYHLHNNAVDVKDDPKYQAFLKQTLAPGQSIQSGVEYLFYLPDQNNFAVLFMKSTLNSYTQPIWACGVGRLIQLSTVWIKGKKNGWYGLNIVPMPRAIKGSNVQAAGQSLSYDVEMPMDLFEKNYKLFNNPQVTTPLEDATVENDIQR